MDTLKVEPPMPEEKKCPQCGAPLPPNAPAGLCPICLLKVGASETVSDAKQNSFSPPAISELAPLFSQLEILELIGKGGMGAVYKARQKQLDRIVALKILPPGIGNDPAFAERFAREAKALAKLNHPNIVTLFEFGDVKNSSQLFYFLMEFVDGVNLRQLLQAGRISPREALAIVPQICDALQFAHDHGIVHRDIKPENILLDRRGRVKVADFGLAKIIEGRDDATNFSAREKVSENLTNAGKVMGTPNYMSPEQKENPGDVDHRADIYALGVVFYQMLTGELPGKKIEPPSKKVLIDVRLDEIVLRALEKNPELRYQQASVLKTQIETIASAPATSSSALPNKAPVESHFSRTAILGALCVLISLVAFFKVFMPWTGETTFYAGSVWWREFCIFFFAHKLPMINPQSPSGARFTFFAAALAATILGWIGVSQIRRAPEKIYGLWLALFDGLLFPLLALAIIIAVQFRANNFENSNSAQNFYIGQTNFPFGDSIEITSVERGENEMTVKGRYNLVSHNSAGLALYITSTNQNTSEGSGTSRPIFKGNGNFELNYINVIPGQPHVSMYADGHPFASVYFGTKEEAAEESRASWITNSGPKFSQRLVAIIKRGTNAPVPNPSADQTNPNLADQPPVVVETFPISGAREVTPGETEIRVRFSKEMENDSWSWSTAWENSEPEFIGKPHYEADGKTCVVKVKLEPDKTYAFWLNSEKFQNFKDTDGRPAVPYLLIFQTKQK